MFTFVISTATSWPRSIISMEINLLRDTGTFFEHRRPKLRDAIEKYTKNGTSIYLNSREFRRTILFRIVAIRKRCFKRPGLKRTTLYRRVRITNRSLPLTRRESLIEKNRNNPTSVLQLQPEAVRLNLALRRKRNTELREISLLFTKTSTGRRGRDSLSIPRASNPIENRTIRSFSPFSSMVAIVKAKVVALDRCQRGRPI